MDDRKLLALAHVGVGEPPAGPSISPGIIAIGSLVTIGLGIGGGFAGYKYGGAKHRVAGTIGGALLGLVVGNVATLAIASTTS